MLEETQDEFLSKCAAAAQNLTDFVDEEDVDDDDYIIDLGDIYLSLSLSLSHIKHIFHTKSKFLMFYILL